MKSYKITNHFKITFLFILGSFFITVLLTSNYLDKFDNYKSYQNKNDHPMIKIAVNNHWSEANKIINDYKSGKTFFESGSNSEDEFLPQKILAFYFLITSKEMYENNLIKTNNGKLFYLSLKSFFYFFLIFIFFLKFRKFFSENVIFPIIIYLSCLPDLIQYHLSFWNESFTFIFQIILIFFLIDFKFSIKKNFLLGMVAALPYLTGQEYLFYFIVFIFYYLFIFLYYKKKTFKFLVSFIIGYSVVLSLVLFINHFKTDQNNLNFYGLKSALYIYVVPQILANKNNTTHAQSISNMKKDAIIWANKNEINFVKSKNLLLEIKENNFRDKIKYNNYMLIYSLKTIFPNLHHVIYLHFKKSMHMLVLNPFFIDNFYKYETIGSFLKSEKHFDLIKYRVVYSLFFYLILFYGFYKSLLFYKPELIFLLVLLISYNILILGLLGSPRYFAPAILYMSLFFGPIFKK